MVSLMASVENIPIIVFVSLTSNEQANLQLDSPHFHRRIQHVAKLTDMETSQPMGSLEVEQERKHQIGQK